MTNALLDRPSNTPTPASTRPAPRRITPNLFAISFGLAGLAQTWSTAARLTSAPAAVAEALWVIDGAVWLTTLAFYLRSLYVGKRWRTELSDHIFGPFVSVPAIVGMLLAGGLEPHAHVAGLALYFVSLAAALALAGHLIAVWALDDAPSTQWHPGYYLPSVGAPIVGAAEAATFGYGSLARLLFGFGVISWVLIGGILLHHLVGNWSPGRGGAQCGDADCWIERDQGVGHGHRRLDMAGRAAARQHHRQRRIPGWPCGR